MSSWAGRRVFVTGHTGFKGAWLCAWLRESGAEICGYSLAPEPRSLYDVLQLGSSMESAFADIRNIDELERTLARYRPEIVFHLAAQALVRDGYRDPAGTFQTNCTGTVNILEAIRNTSSVRGAVIVTTDKCYEPRTDGRPFREDHRLGGHDPYSASKACAEIATAAYRSSFFGDGPIVATARAGNVIGGGDWSKDRIVPDVMRAAEQGQPVALRYPDAVRPWQHVFDPLWGYLLLAERMYSGDRTVACAWNFGPAPGEVTSVKELVENLQRRIGTTCGVTGQGSAPYENPVLLLDSAKARDQLGWSPRYDVGAAVEVTAAWYQAFFAGENMRSFSLEQLETYAR